MSIEVQRAVLGWFRGLTDREPMEVQIDWRIRNTRIARKGMFFARLDEPSVPRGRSIRPRATQRYPLLIVAFYGPNDDTVTKIVLTLHRSEFEEGGMLRRSTEGILANPGFLEEAKAFLRDSQAVAVTCAGGTIGCPHEEGVDFPVGADCPRCPFWRGKQGSTAERGS